MILGMISSAASSAGPQSPSADALTAASRPLSPDRGVSSSSGLDATLMTGPCHSDSSARRIDRLPVPNPPVTAAARCRVRRERRSPTSLRRIT